jgi:hypothetical protein
MYYLILDFLYFLAFTDIFMLKHENLSSMINDTKVIVWPLRPIGVRSEAVWILATTSELI